MLSNVMLNRYNSSVMLKANTKESKPVKDTLIVDDTLYRGGLPTEESLQNLKKAGVTTVIDFTTTKGIPPNHRPEKDVVNELGMNYYNIPFLGEYGPLSSQVEDFFKIIDDAKSKDEKVYVHCSFGKDRTGLFVGLYKLKYGISDINGCVSDLLSLGHRPNRAPAVIPFLIEYDKKLRTETNLNMSPDNILGQSLINKKDYRKTVTK